MPRADIKDDLNRSPSTTVDLRFIPVTETGGVTSHGFIVVTDNATGKTWVSEAGAGGARYWGTVPSGPMVATTKEKDAASIPDQRQAASFGTDVPAKEVANRLSIFSSAFTAKRIPYGYPAIPAPVAGPPFMPPRELPEFPVTNSNYYASAAWDDLTGTVPKLPRGLIAPGWGDHRMDIPR